MSSSVVQRRFMGGSGGPSPPPRTHRHHSWDNHLGEKRTTLYKRVTPDGVITTHTTYDDAHAFRKSKYFRWWCGWFRVYSLFLTKGSWYNPKSKLLHITQLKLWLPS